LFGPASALSEKKNRRLFPENENRRGKGKAKTTGGRAGLYHVASPRAEDEQRQGGRGEGGEGKRQVRIKSATFPGKKVGGANMLTWHFFMIKERLVGKI